jgi:hypothetical protein
MNVSPPIRAIVLRKVWPLIVTFTGTRTLPKAALGSKGTGMAHMPPSLRIETSTVFDVMVITPNRQRPSTVIEQTGRNLNDYKRGCLMIRKTQNPWTRIRFI